MKEGDWNVDAFYTALVPVEANELDKADWKQPLYGVYTTYTDSPGNLLDLYYIGYDNRHEGAPILTDFSLHTFGTRYLRTIDAWMFEYEAAASSVAKAAWASITKPPSRPSASVTRSPTGGGSLYCGAITTTPRAMPAADRSIGSTSCFPGATTTWDTSTQCSDRTSKRPIYSLR
jgi:hypothetical protein